MAREDIHVGLEIGTSKVCAVVAECREDGDVRLLGVGETPSRGVRKGEIIDFENASNCVRDALSDAEEKSDVEIKSVWLSVTGGHVESFNNRGSVTLHEEGSEITEYEMQEVELKAKEISLPRKISSCIRSSSITTWTASRACSTRWECLGGNSRRTSTSSTA